MWLNCCTNFKCCSTEQVNHCSTIHLTCVFMETAFRTRLLWTLSSLSTPQPTSCGLWRTWSTVNVTFPQQDEWRVYCPEPPWLVQVTITKQDCLGRPEKLGKGDFTNSVTLLPGSKTKLFLCCESEFKGVVPHCGLLTILGLLVAGGNVFTSSKLEWAWGVGWRARKGLPLAKVVLLWHVMSSNVPCGTRDNARSDTGLEYTVWY